MASLKINNVYINDYYSLIGKNESLSCLKKYDDVIDDYYFKEKTFELAEVKMQRVVIDKLLSKNDADYLLSGDLINQIAISSYAARYYNLSFIGLYAACSTFTEELLLSSLLVEKTGKAALCITSSHNLTAERQYRFPVEYGSQKPKTSTYTLTSSVGCTVSNKKSNIIVKGGTFGKCIDLGINDVTNMGAVMAPACADTLHEHLKASNKKLGDYDLILTGDLGYYGLKILKEYYEKCFHEKINNILDSGCEIFYQKDNLYSGGSGPCCLPVYFFCNVLCNHKYKNILLLGTGSLHTPVFLNQKNTIPAVCHAIEIEVIR